MGQTVGLLCQGKRAISQSHAGLPSIPSAPGGQTLPEALGGDVNIPNSRPQRAGVGGKRRGTIQEGFPVQQRPPPRDLQVAATSSCLRDRTNRDTTIQAFAWLETHQQANSTWRASHCERTQTFLKTVPPIPQYPFSCFHYGTWVLSPWWLNRGGGGGTGRGGAATRDKRRIPCPPPRGPGSWRERCNGCCLSICKFLQSAREWAPASRDQTMQPSRACRRGGAGTRRRPDLPVFASVLERRPTPRVLAGRGTESSETFSVKRPAESWNK